MEIIVDILEFIISLFIPDRKQNKDRESYEVVEVQRTAERIDMKDQPPLAEPLRVERQNPIVEEEVMEIEQESVGMDPREAMKWSLIFSQPRAREPYRLPTLPRKYRS